jgi:protein arginine kinase activator
MMCDVCKTKKATVYLTQIVKGEMQKVNLCENCSREKGVTDPIGFAMADKLLGFAHGEKIESQPQERTCPSCGMPHTTFRKTGRLGCAKCYGVFGDGMDNLLKAMHKGTQHTGKIPVRAVRQQAPEIRLGELRSALEEAIAGEKFEDAARLRDEIRRITETV